MKRIVAMMVVAVILFATAGMAMAEGNEFKLEDFEGFPGYRYDKFEKKWIANATYTKKYSDAELVLGMTITGDKKNVTGPVMLYGWVRDKKNNEGLYQVIEVNLLIDETVITFENLAGDKDNWTAPIDSENGMVFAKKLSNAKSVSLKYKFKTGSISLDLSKKDFNELKEFSKSLVSINPWQFILDDKGLDMKGYDDIIKARWPMEIEE